MAVRNQNLTLRLELTTLHRKSTFESISIIIFKKIEKLFEFGIISTSKHSSNNNNVNRSVDIRDGKQVKCLSIIYARLELIFTLDKSSLRLISEEQVYNR